MSFSTLPNHVGRAVDPQIIHGLILNTSPDSDFLVLAFCQLFHCMWESNLSVFSPGYLSFDLNYLHPIR